MSASFYRTAFSLRNDNGLMSSTAGIVAIALVGGWLAWACNAKVTRYESSDSARLQLNSSSYSIEANHAGRLATMRMALGREVHAGDVLAELDNGAQALTLAAERAKVESLAPQLAAIRAQIESERAGTKDEQQVLAVSVDGVLAQYRQAEARAQNAEREAQRAQQLQASGILASAEAEKAVANAKSERAAAESIRLAASRLTPESSVRERSRDIRIKQLLEDEAKVQAEQERSKAAIKLLTYDIERQRILAPVSGRIAECATLTAGSYISEGQKLGAILPAGDIQVVASFAPSAAMGKIHPGQFATVRLDGFPWAQYGTIRAQVSKVADEIREGKVRVELAVISHPNSQIPLQHGLPGTVEVELEQTTPAMLLLRSAGAWVGGH